jgi:diguanylate cyclase (GGDEF)-like protein
VSDSALKFTDFDKYFSLLHKLIPASAGFAFCDSAGYLIATRCNTGDLETGDHIDLEAFRPTGNNSHSYNTCLSVADTDRPLVKVDICNRFDEAIASLLVITGNEDMNQGGNDHTTIGEILHTVSVCVAKENELSDELNAMARELTDRYEELNLVYETNDEIIEFENEADAYDQLLQNCVEHLDLGAAILIFPEQETIYYITAKHDPFQSPLYLLQQFSIELYQVIRETRNSILINDFADPVRAGLGMEIPYKIMAAPVVNGKGAVTGMIVCLNHMHKTDYFNSDKNLLNVMSRKVSKIIQANYDSLTGLMNMHSFQPRLNEAINSSRSKGIFHSLLNIDLEQLRVINDTFGRGAGDAAIEIVSSILKEKLRKTDTISYLGEGRFGVLLEKSSLEQGMRVAESVRDAIANKELAWKSKSVDISASIGMALIEPSTENADIALEAAEIARESAKESGMNQIQVFRHGDRDLEYRKDQMQWVSRIQNALREDNFRIYCQVIHPLTSTNEKYHFEILLRLRDEKGSIISPGDFIPPAERFNLMPILDRWVIDRTFSILQKNGFAQQAFEGVVSINLSGQSLTDTGLIEYIDRKLAKYQLSSNCICFEITETAAISNMESAKHVITVLRAKGFHFSLDDFGTGLSSFSYLKDLPVDYLKIDGSFVREITGDKIAHAMVASINQIGHIIGLKTIAEFVETDKIINRLQLIGVDYVQGYAICKPMPLEEYLTLLAADVATQAG